jgi:hypothetical protein
MFLESPRSNLLNELGFPVDDNKKKVLVSFSVSSRGTFLNVILVRQSGTTATDEDNDESKSLTNRNASLPLLHCFCLKLNWMQNYSVHSTAS